MASPFPKSPKPTEHDPVATNLSVPVRAGPCLSVWIWLARRRRLVRVTAVIIVAIVAILTWPMDTDRYLRVASSNEMVDRSGRLMYAFLNEDQQWCFRRDLDGFGQRLVDATVAAEDQRFYKHPGVDPIAVVRAVVQNAGHARIVSGGSTITMQVVKRDRPGGRRWIGKLCQAVRALRLERRCTKEAILCAYLNTAPYGLNLVGAEAAAQRYFGKAAREMTISEAALLAGLPKSPTALMPLRNPEGARDRRNYVLRRMRDEGFISESEFRQACADPLGVEWRAFPKLSPHLAMTLRPRMAECGSVKVTLDTDIQRRVERLVRRWLPQYSGDIGNAAAMVVDAPTASVLARVGSADFFDMSGGGQVDACRAPRSPGSALKPFNYALAMERDVLYASETLLDDSLDLGAYNPANFDGSYNGLVSAESALRYSLNVPAVLVLERIRADTLQTFLCDLGFTTLNRRSRDYGLGLTLGNCEVRLDQMMAAYCMLANLGEYRPLATVAGPERTRGCNPLSRGTCLKVFDMLQQRLPEELDGNLVRAGTPQPRVCWKTGTSTGQCDAWAFVFNRQYVVGVWLGNSSGKSSKRLVGVATALPLAARVFRALPPSNVREWPEDAGDLHTVAVCSISGLPASPWCAKTRRVTLPTGQYLHRVCDVHYPAPGNSGGIVERWPGCAKGWDLARVEAPRVAAKPSDARREALRILTPTDQGEYVLTGEPEGDRLRLRASLDAGAALHWYIDDRYLATSTPDAPFLLDLSPGVHRLACMTPQGTTDSITFKVTEPQGGRPRFAKREG